MCLDITEDLIAMSCIGVIKSYAYNGKKKMMRLIQYIM